MHQESLALIIPLHRQADSLARVLHGVELQTLPPKRIYLVLDRPETENVSKDGVLVQVDSARFIKDLAASSPLRNSIEVVICRDPPAYIGRPPSDPCSQLFLAGHVRNLGLEAAQGDGLTSFVFIDGDCTPEDELIESHMRVLSRDLPALTLGRRRESILGWLDRREIERAGRMPHLFGESETVLHSERLAMELAWSCNLGLNRRAVDLIRRLNSQYFRRDELFSSEFHGQWGGEDAFLGLQAHLAHVFVCTVRGGRSGVCHLDHPTRKSGSDEVRHAFFVRQCRRYRRKLAQQPMAFENIARAFGPPDSTAPTDHESSRTAGTSPLPVTSNIE